ncbi:acyl-CoA reductase [Flavobacterium sp. U410]|jgi:hypothetical protein
MLQNEIKDYFVQLGFFLKQFDTEFTQNNNVLHNDLFFDQFASIIENQQHLNGWFTKEQVVHAVQAWANALTTDNLNQWLQSYHFSDNKKPKIVGLILAGNIPLVGFHDVLSVLISGNIAKIKLSSNDQQLLKAIVKYLVALNPEFADRIQLVEGKLENFDAVIATGSNNTARYFEYYFREKPSIIRKNRNSVAVLTGKETKEDLIGLGEDIFRYFGLGCRNVSKIFIPKDYDFKTFFEAMYEYGDIIHYEKYANNYDYNKAVFLMSNFKLLDNEFLTLKEDEGYSSPISSVFYEYYDSLDIIKDRLKNDVEKIQCIVSKNVLEQSIPFGKTQQPELWDYADNVDTLDFLLNL